MPESCMFCDILAGRRPAAMIAESEHVVSFLSLNDHPMIVPRAHIANIYEVDSVVGPPLMAMLSQVAVATKAALNADGIYVTQANDAAAGQDVFHLHFHVYPRWMREPQLSADRNELAARIADHLSST